MIDWLREYEGILALMGLLSVGSLVTAFFLTPWALSLISADYFLRDDKASPCPGFQFRRCLITILRNLVGGSLAMVGVALLALPGQGILTIFAGLLLMSFPGKSSLELWLVRLPLVLKSVNWMRARRGKDPLHLMENPASTKDCE